MRLSGTIVSIAGSVIILSAALVVGLGVREIRTRKALEMHQAVAKAEQERAAQLTRSRTGPMARRPDNRPTSDEIRGGREDMRARYENMSDEERDQFSRDRTSMFRAEGGGGPGQFGGGRTGQFGGGMSSQDRDAMRARFENMTEEERQAAMEEMRSRFGGTRGGRSSRGGSRFGDGGGGSDGGFRRPGGEGSDMGSFGGGEGSAESNQQ